LQNFNYQEVEYIFCYHLLCYIDAFCHHFNKVLTHVRSEKRHKAIAINNCALQYVLHFNTLYVNSLFYLTTINK